MALYKYGSNISEFNWKGRPIIQAYRLGRKFWPPAHEYLDSITIPGDALVNVYDENGNYIRTEALSPEGNINIQDLQNPHPIQNHPIVYGGTYHLSRQDPAPSILQSVRVNGVSADVGRTSTYTVTGWNGTGATWDSVYAPKEAAGTTISITAHVKVIHTTDTKRSGLVNFYVINQGGASCSPKMSGELTVSFTVPENGYSDRSHINVTLWNNQQGFDIIQASKFDYYYTFSGWSDRINEKNANKPVRLYPSKIEYHDEDGNVLNTETHLDWSLEDKEGALGVGLFDETGDFYSYENLA